MDSSDNNLLLPQNPLVGLELWLEQAQEAKCLEPTAMTLTTVRQDGSPNARIVLFKGMASNSLGEVGLTFYTNYMSPKAHELDNENRTCAVFYWPQMFRQIRVNGRAEKLSPQESEKYFSSRPRGSQIGAWASPQSQVISDRTELETRVAEVEKKFQGRAIPCPPSWGGWIIVPSSIEFWQGVTDRLHDRFRFVIDDSGQWNVQRLAP